MPGVGLDIEAGHLCIGDASPFAIAFFIQRAAHGQAGLGCGGGNKGLANLNMPADGERTSSGPRRYAHGRV